MYMLYTFTIKMSDTNNTNSKSSKHLYVVTK